MSSVRSIEYSDSVVAVGYKIDFSALGDILKEHLPNKKIAKYETLSGVWYSSGCRGGLQDAMKSEKDLLLWFNSKKPKRIIESDDENDEENQEPEYKYDDRCFVKKLHIAINNRLVVGEVYRDMDIIYSFFYNENGISTTGIKKQINNKDSNFRSIDIERVVLSCRPYIHRMVNNKNVIEVA